MKMNNLTGMRFGRLMALSYEKKKSGNRKRIFWLCRCDCGKTSIVHSDVLTRNVVKSCGCLRAEVTRKRSLRHGGSVGYKECKEYKAWSHAKSRCYNPNDLKYKNYGARGIKMCDKWLNDYNAFWEDMGKCPDGLTLDRIDVHGNYEPSNCHWATSMVQGRHRTDNVWITYKDKTMIQSDWAREMKSDVRIFNKLWKKGCTMDYIAKRMNYE